MWWMGWLLTAGGPTSGWSVIGEGSAPILPGGHLVLATDIPTSWRGEPIDELLPSGWTAIFEARSLPVELARWRGRVVAVQAASACRAPVEELRVIEGPAGRLLVGRMTTACALQATTTVIGAVTPVPVGDAPPEITVQALGRFRLLPAWLAIQSDYLERATAWPDPLWDQAAGEMPWVRTAMMGGRRYVFVSASGGACSSWNGAFWAAWVVDPLTGGRSAWRLLSDPEIGSGEFAPKALVTSGDSALMFNDSGFAVTTPGPPQAVRAWLPPICP